MEARLDLYKSNPGSIRALRDMDARIARSGLEKPLIELVSLRVAQINGSGACMDAHTRNAREAGEDEQRLSKLASWREPACSEGCFTDRERAALEWTEGVTLIASSQVPDAVWNRVRPHFTPEELIDLTLLVSIANIRNRFAISFRSKPL